MCDNFDNEEEHVFANFNTIKREFPASAELVESSEGNNHKYIPKSSNKIASHMNSKFVQSSKSSDAQLPIQKYASDFTTQLRKGVKMSSNFRFRSMAGVKAYKNRKMARCAPKRRYFRRKANKLERRILRKRLSLEDSFF